mgnify:CR=1 FL=1
MDDKILNWVTLAEKFSIGGDPNSMRTVAREIFDLDKNSAEGLAIMAESSLYLGSLDEAESLAQYALSVDANHLRGRLVSGGVAIKEFRLNDQLKLLAGVINDAHAELKSLRAQLNAHNHRFAFNRRKKTSADDDFQEQLNKKIFITQSLLFKALCWSSNGLYLSGEPARAAAALAEASTLTDNSEQAAELYSKHLFLRNYRDVSAAQTNELARKYNDFFARLKPFAHDKKNLDANKKLHIGYISPDFREHALANFMTPLLTNFDADNFSVTCYSTGRKDAVTAKLKSLNVGWRDLIGKDALAAAKLIDADAVDILVDLSGHSQDSSLPILAYKPAPVQICALGYTATTGLNAVDYFLSDKICLPETSPNAFTEKILRVDPCGFCYAPGLIRDMPEPARNAPVLKNGFMTYGSFNNFAKVTEDVLYLWRAILDSVPRSRLVLKNKLCSLDDGKALVRERLRKMGFQLERVELRPYSPDYLEQYADLDVALDTFPYTGGTTTCEALYMGVPVITLRGKTHGSRLGASILNAADVSELIAQSPMDYVKKAVRLNQRRELTAAYHSRLREHVKNSALMDGQKYIRELEKLYRAAWKDYCRSLLEKNFSSTFQI